jgi:putative transcriptional regulator
MTQRGARSFTTASPCCEPNAVSHAADALGVHYQTIGYLERGEYSPSLYLALRIAEYFGIPVEVIFSASPFPRIGAETEAG